MADVRMFGYAYPITPLGVPLLRLGASAVKHPLDAAAYPPRS